MGITARLVAKFNTYYADKPGTSRVLVFSFMIADVCLVLTIMMTNAVSNDNHNLHNEKYMKRIWV